MKSLIPPALMLALVLAGPAAARHSHADQSSHGGHRGELSAGSMPFGGSASQASAGFRAKSSNDGLDAATATYALPKLHAAASPYSQGGHRARKQRY